MTPPDHGSDAPPRLSRPAFAVCLLIVLGIFVGLEGPFWRRPDDIDLVTRHIVWSYLPIPGLVAAALAIERALSLAGWLIECLKLTLTKFAITYVFAATMWLLFPPGQSGSPSAGSAAVAESAQRQRPEHTDRARTTADAIRIGSIAGRVVTRHAAPVRGAFVFVSSGLDHLRFPAPPDPAHLSPSTDRVVVQTGQALMLEPDTVLHTAVGTAGGRPVFNRPIPPGGAPAPVVFARPYGEVTVRCRVHPEEPPRRVIVVDSPHHARTDDDGRFTLSGVPPGTLEVTATWSGQRTVATAIVTAGNTAQLELSLR